MVSLGEDLHSGGYLVSVYDLTFVAFEWSSRHKDSLSVGTLVRDPSIKLALLEALVICTGIVLGKGFIDKLETCVDDVMALN